MLLAHLWGSNLKGYRASSERYLCLLHTKEMRSSRYFRKVQVATVPKRHQSFSIAGEEQTEEVWIMHCSK